MFCCHSFKLQIQEVGKRGISIIARSAPSCFLLQSRGIDLQDKDKLPRIGDEVKFDMTIDVKINIVCEIGICFCPWCGRDLGEWIRENEQDFDQLQAMHKPYVEAKW